MRLKVLPFIPYYRRQKLGYLVDEVDECLSVASFRLRHQIA
jgi:hypothetical protein